MRHGYCSATDPGRKHTRPNSESVSVTTPSHAVVDLRVATPWQPMNAMEKMLFALYFCHVTWIVETLANDVVYTAATININEAVKKGVTRVHCFNCLASFGQTV